MREMSKLITMWACFRNLRYFKETQQNFRHNVATLATKIMNIKKLISFRRILYTSQIKHANVKRDRKMSCLMLHTATTKIRMSKLRTTFTLIKRRAGILQKLCTCVI